MRLVVEPCGMVPASAEFLHCMPHHGWFVGTLVATPVAINLTRRLRSPQPSLLRSCAVMSK